MIIGSLQNENIASIKNKLTIAVSFSLLIAISACGTTPKRPAYTGTDTVGSLSNEPFIGTWQYSILNPSIEQEKNISAVYRFNADGTFSANTDTTMAAEIPMKMESDGTWDVNGEKFTLTIGDVRETSGNELAALAINLTRAMLKKQSGEMNPYSITANRIVMLSEEHGTALQLDRLQ